MLVKLAPGKLQNMVQDKHVRLQNMVQAYGQVTVLEAKTCIRQDSLLHIAIRFGNVELAEAVLRARVRIACVKPRESGEKSEVEMKTVAGFTPACGYSPGFNTTLTNPLLYYYSNKCKNSFGVSTWKAMTAAITKVLKNALVGANLADG